MLCKSKGKKAHSGATSPSLGVCIVPEKTLTTVEDFSKLDEEAAVNELARSPATAPEKYLDDTSSVNANSLGLQVQSDVASAFSPQG